MVKLTYSEHSLLHSHVQLAQVSNKSGEGEHLKKKIQFFFHKSNYGGCLVWFGLVSFPWQVRNYHLDCEADC